MQPENSVSTFKIVPMARHEAAMLVKRMMGCYPSLSLHDPEVYIAELVTVLARHPLDVGEKAIEETKLESPKFLPTVPEVAKACEAIRPEGWSYAQEFEAQSRRQLEDRRQRELEDEREPLEHRRKVAERILAEFHAATRGPSAPIETAATVKAKYGLTDQQWDALRDGPEMQAASVAAPSRHERRARGRLKLPQRVNSKSGDAPPLAPQEPVLDAECFKRIVATEELSKFVGQVAADNADSG